MTTLWTSVDIAKAVGGTASADFTVGGVAFDSREVGRDDLFIALKGEATDGHRFLDGAFAQGAAGAIVSQPVSHPHILVADTIAALDALGVASRGRTAARIAGVTGSVGKTGTKEALSAALARANRGSVHKSVKSYNNHTGVPLSLSRMPADSAFGVFEMGMNHAGELSALTRLVRPHVALVTAIAPAHIEYFGSVEAIADAKGEIFEGLEPGGIAILPYDSPHYARLRTKAESCGAHSVTFGRGAGADVSAVEAMETVGGTAILARLPGAELSFTLAYPGEHWISNAMAVLAAVQALGGDLAAAGLALGEMEGLAGRGARHVIRTTDGGDALIIDESYNANPASMAATLAVLGAAKASRRIAVLGEMRELGADGEGLHAGLADPIAQADVDLALLVGPAMAPLKKALEGRCETVHAPDAASALESLEGRVQSGDVLLIKGSNAVGLSRIVEALISNRSH
jgi:UDP-N-acetylmuramoyl-tripeptide--D-alanyl-D-alanine ligase